MLKKVASIALLVVLVFAVAALAVPTASAKRPPVGGGGGCICPDVFDPVYCTSNGLTYSNFCQAGCAGATGCTRTGDI
jgi:hypothetical protein